VRQIGVFLVLCFLMSWATSLPKGDALGAHITLVAGLLLLSGHVIGHLMAGFRLPRITGYLCVGLLMGPYILGFMTVETVEELGFLNELAVTFIALAAGGELRVAELRDRMRTIMVVIVSLTIVVSGTVTLTVVLAQFLLPFTASFSGIQVLSVAVLFGTLAVARSPSSAIAVINECKARGPFTEAALGVTVVMDVLVILMFAAAISFCENVMVPSGSLDFSFLGALGFEIILGITAGWIIGRGLAFYTDRVHANLSLLLLGTALLVTSLSHGLSDYLKDTHDLVLRLEPLLICVTAGFTVQNHSEQGEKFIGAVNAVSLPVYVLFFTLAGAGLNLNALQQTWGIALLLAAVRATAIFFAAYAGGRLSGDPPHFNRIAGMAYLTQAGVSLGLAMEVVRRFPEWGEAFVTVVVAVIAINQMVGPIAMRKALIKSGEAQVAA
jgi:Kef-type K+ transport system membrane component KefB